MPTNCATKYAVLESGTLRVIADPTVYLRACGMTPANKRDSEPDCQYMESFDEFFEYAQSGGSKTCIAPLSTPEQEALLRKP